MHNQPAVPQGGRGGFEAEGGRGVNCVVDRAVPRNSDEVLLSAVRGGGVGGRGRADSRKRVSSDANEAVWMPRLQVCVKEALYLRGRAQKANRAHTGGSTKKIQRPSDDRNQNPSGFFSSLIPHPPKTQFKRDR